jgi:hypothetical protein
MQTSESCRRGYRSRYQPAAGPQPPEQEEHMPSFTGDSDFLARTGAEEYLDIASPADPAAIPAETSLDFCGF